MKRLCVVLLVFAAPIAFAQTDVVCSSTDVPMQCKIKCRTLAQCLETGGSCTQKLTEFDSCLGVETVVVVERRQSGYTTFDGFGPYSGQTPQPVFGPRIRLVRPPPPPPPPPDDGTPCMLGYDPFNPSSLAVGVYLNGTCRYRPRTCQELATMFGMTSVALGGLTLGTASAALGTIAAVTGLTDCFETADEE